MFAPVDGRLRLQYERVLEAVFRAQRRRLVSLFYLVVTTVLDEDPAFVLAVPRQSTSFRLA